MCNCSNSCNCREVITKRGEQGIQGATGPAGLTGPTGADGVSVVTAGSNNIVTGTGTPGDPYIVGHTVYSIGDYAHGGIVFWVDETGEHGLVCSMLDQSAGVRWHAGTNGFTQAKGDGIGAGKLNTVIAVSSLVSIGDDGADSAVRIANETSIIVGGTKFGDWYLPSVEEFDFIRDNRVVIDAGSIAHGGAAILDTSYWTSSEGAADTASRYVMPTAAGLELKTQTYRVRVIRSF